MPLLGRLAGDSDAYTYLPNSVKRFPAPPALAAEMERAGLRDISYLLTAGGIIAIHAGTVPLEPGLVASRPSRSCFRQDIR